jgi:hypothetical protein
MFQHFIQSLYNFERIEGIRFNKLGAKSKRVINRLKAYLEEKDTNLINALGGIVHKGKKGNKCFYVCSSEDFFNKLFAFKIRTKK